MLKLCVGSLSLKLYAFMLVLVTLTHTIFFLFFIFLQEYMKLSILVLVTRDTNVFFCVFCLFFCFVTRTYIITSIGLGDLDSYQG